MERIEPKPADRQDHVVPNCNQVNTLEKINQVAKLVTACGNDDGDFRKEPKGRDNICWQAYD